jgi:hypothetical protein
VRRRVVGDLVDGSHCEGWGGCAGVVGRSGFVVGGGRSSSD